MTVLCIPCPLRGFVGVCMRVQSLNPFKMFLQLLGPGMCFKLCCCIITLGILVACVFLAPFLNVVIAW